ncbi:hypothetical protein ABT324_16265 [Saccharopolyspora sp. NPDC000359]|uniref:hypothetical protein n=1 Tax=Saccharopolyspora sp. NPDC000359 TaxID=3154251 RepID=UPI00332A3A00
MTTTDPAKSARCERNNAIRAQVADEGNEAIEAEVAENAAAPGASLTATARPGPQPAGKPFAGGDRDV